MLFAAARCLGVKRRGVLPVAKFVADFLERHQLKVAHASHREVLTCIG